MSRQARAAAKEPDSRTVTFRLPKREYAWLAERARDRGLSPGGLARELVLAGFAGLPGTGSDAQAAYGRASSGGTVLEELLARAVWAVVVALSPDMDEDAAERFVREYCGWAVAPNPGSGKESTP